MLSSDGILSTTPPEILVSCPRKRKLLAAKCGALDHGFFLILLSLGVAVFDSSNSLAIGLAFFILLIGIMLVMMGFLGGQETGKKQAQAPGYSVYTREIVKVRYSHCGSLNIETSTRCTNCGASL